MLLWLTYTKGQTISPFQLMIIAYSVKVIYKYFHVRFLSKQQITMIDKHLNTISIASNVT